MVVVEKEARLREGDMVEVVGMEGARNKIMGAFWSETFLLIAGFYLSVLYYYAYWLSLSLSSSLFSWLNLFSCSN